MITTRRTVRDVRDYVIIRRQVTARVMQIVDFITKQKFNQGDSHKYVLLMVLIE